MALTGCRRVLGTFVNGAVCVYWWRIEPVLCECCKAAAAAIATTTTTTSYVTIVLIIITNIAH